MGSLFSCDPPPPPPRPAPVRRTPQTRQPAYTYVPPARTATRPPAPPPPASVLHVPPPPAPALHVLPPPAPVVHVAPQRLPDRTTPTRSAATAYHDPYLRYLNPTNIRATTSSAVHRDYDKLEDIFGYHASRKVAATPVRHIEFEYSKASTQDARSADNLSKASASTTSARFKGNSTSQPPREEQRSSAPIKEPTNNVDTQPMGKQSCRLFLQGYCRFGDNCRFSHHLTTSAEKGKTVSNDTKTVQHCYAWKSGHCNRGNRCPFLHDPDVRAAEQARLAKVAEEEETMTVDHTVFSTTKVTFGAGAAVHKVVTGFESCRIVVKNLPTISNKTDVVTLFTQPGFDPNKFKVLSLRTAADGVHQDAIVAFDDMENATNALIGLQDIQFGNEGLKLETMSKQGEMGASDRDPNLLVVTWPAPSKIVVATYPNMEVARSKITQLDKKLCSGHKVHVELNRKPQNLPEKFFNPASVRITGLPVEATMDVIQNFSGSLEIRELKSRKYDLLESFNQLYDHVVAYLQDRKGMLSFKAFPTISETGMVSANIRFESWDKAKVVYTSLKDRPMIIFGGAKCYLSLRDPLHFLKYVPFQQYKAQESIFKSLEDKSQKNAKADVARVRVFANQNQTGRNVRIEVSGSDKKAVGSLKVRIEQLVAGEKVRSWDRFFGSKGGEGFLRSVFEATNAFVRRDGTLNCLRVFGEPRAIEEAKEMIEAEVERLASTESTIFLKRASIRFFVNKGAAILKELVGDENVKLDVGTSPCKITIRGGEEARHTLRRLVDESLAPTSQVDTKTAAQQCPICFDDIDNPFRLACGHSYCNTCLRHFLTTASDTKLFPLSCMGNDSTCGKEISIPTIQRFLLPAQQNQLFEASFLEYMDRHPHEFKHCPTADCPQIYRAGDGANGVVQCPSCFASTCVSCREDHEGFTCDEWKLHRDPGEQERLLREWAASNPENVRKCPNCQAWIEKNGGCNHMTCTKCKSHICWKCMGIFVSGIYDHLNEVHGGAFDY